ncbi:MAG: hypothetical protein ACTSUE_07635 [Promethearchaeota archaeon]
MLRITKSCCILALVVLWNLLPKALGKMVVNDQEYHITQFSIFFGYGCESHTNVSLVAFNKDNHDLCDDSLSTDIYQDKMVALDGVYSGAGGQCAYEERYKKLQDLGAIGIIDVHASEPGMWVYTHSTSAPNLENYTISMYSVDKNQFGELNIGETLEISHLECDDSRWNDFNSLEWILLKIIGTIGFLIVAGIGVHYLVYSLQAIWVDDIVRVPIREIILANNVFWSIVLAFQYVLGIVYTGPLIATNVRIIGITMWTAPETFSLLLNALYLWDVYYSSTLSQPAPPTHIRHKKLIWGIAFVFSGFGLYRVYSGVFTFSPSFGETVGGSIFALMRIAAGLFYFVIGKKFLKFIEDSTHKSKNSKSWSTMDAKLEKFVHHMTTYLNWCAVFIVGGVIGIGFIASGTTSYPLSSALVTYWMMVCKMGTLYTQILALKPKVDAPHPSPTSSTCSCSNSILNSILITSSSPTVSALSSDRKENTI